MSSSTNYTRYMKKTRLGRRVAQEVLKELQEGTVKKPETKQKGGKE